MRFFKSDDFWANAGCFCEVFENRRFLGYLKTSLAWERLGGPIGLKFGILALNMPRNDIRLGFLPSMTWGNSFEGGGGELNPHPLVGYKKTHPFKG